MGENSRLTQPLRVALSVLGLVIFILVLVAVDENVFRDQGPFGLPEGSSLREDQIRTAQTYEVYRQWVYHERQRAFSWHARSTKIVFYVFVLFSVSGMTFSFWQFVASTREARRALELEETQLEMKTQLLSLALKSRSMAAVVLVISVAYFLVYALFIYPLNDATSRGSLVLQNFPGSQQVLSLESEVMKEAINKPLE